MTTVAWTTYRSNIEARLAAACRLISPLSVALGVVAAYGVFVAWRLRITGSDPSFFVIAGPTAADPSHTLPNLHVFSGATYDGQFFYRLAIEPWTDVQTAYGITLDVPAYRQQRLLYPLLAWAVSGGMWQLAPIALIAVNLGAVAALAYSAAVYATRHGRSGLASLMVPLYPGYLVTIARDLAELTEAALLTFGLVLLERRRFWSASAALTLGAFARETLLGVPIAGVIVWAVQRARRDNSPGGPPLLVWAIPLVAYGAWSVLMLLRWGTTGWRQGMVNFGAPLDALVHHLQALGIPDPRANRVEIGLLVLIAATLVATVITHRRRLVGPGVLPLACVLYAVLALFYASYVWQDDYAYLRALHDLVLVGSLALLSVNAWVARALGCASVVLWAGFALQIGPAP